MIKKLRSRDLSFFLLVIGIYAALYLINNNFQYFEIWHIPRTQFDDLIAFSPSWIWIYLAAYLLPGGMFFFLRKYDLQNHFLQLFLILTILTNVIFFLFPSTIDRPMAPTEGLDELTKLAFNFLFAADKPFNCFPSTHVSTALIAALSVKQYPRLFSIFSFIALLISFSAVAIGQHYLYDAIGGAFIALLTVVVHERTIGMPVPALGRIS